MILFNIYYYDINHTLIPLHPQSVAKSTGCGGFSSDGSMRTNSLLTSSLLFFKIKIKSVYVDLYFTFSSSETQLKHIPKTVHKVKLKYKRY